VLNFVTVPLVEGLGGDSLLFKVGIDSSVVG